MIRLPRFEYLLPRSLSEACTMLKELGGDARLLAGGTDLLVSMKQRVIQPRYLVDLSGISGLDFISYSDQEGLRIGPMTRVREICASRPIRSHYPALAEAAWLVASPLHQNSATIGGNICLDARCWYYNQSDLWRKSRDACLKLDGETCYIAKGSKACYAVYSADIAPALWLYGARLKLTGPGGERSVPVEGFFTGDGKKETVRSPDEILSEVVVPPPPAGSRAVYVKFRPRASIDFPVAAVALSLLYGDSRGPCREAKVVMNAIAPAPVAAPEVEGFLTGRAIDEATIARAGEIAYREAKPISDSGGFSPVFKKRMIRFLTVKALRQALER